jgi:hypothetical protein
MDSGMEICVKTVIFIIRATEKQVYREQTVLTGGGGGL